MKKIFVTGVGGYIGSHTVYTLLKNGYAVVGIDNLVQDIKKPQKN